MNRALVYVLLAVMALLWGVVFVAIKLGGQAMPIAVFNADRFVLGWGLLALVTWRTGRWQRVSWRPALELTVLGIIGHGLMQLVFVSGIMRTSASAAALIYGCTPLTVAALAALCRLEHLRARQWGGILLALAGMATVVLLKPAAGGTPQTVLGNVLVAGAVLLMAVYTVLSRRLLGHFDLWFTTTWVLGVGAVVMVIWSWPHQHYQLYRDFHFSDWAVLAYGAIFALAVPNLLYLLGVRELGRARTAAFVNAVPLLGCLAAWLLLGERLEAGQLIGGAAILGGIALTQTGAAT